MAQQRRIAFHVASEFHGGGTYGRQNAYRAADGNETRGGGHGRDHRAPRGAGRAEARRPKREGHRRLHRLRHAGLSATHARASNTRPFASRRCAIPIAAATTIRVEPPRTEQLGGQVSWATANWAQGARGGLCGREIVRKSSRATMPRKLGKAVTCPGYADFREMLDKEKSLDAVYIMTPEHLHGVIAARR